MLVTGAELSTQGVHGGPVICTQNSPFQCAQPSAAAVLHLTPGPPPIATLQAHPTQLAFAAGTVAIATLTHNGNELVDGIHVDVPPGVPIDVDLDSCSEPLAPAGNCQLLLTADEPLPTTVPLTGAVNAFSVGIEVTLTPDDTLFANGFDPSKSGSLSQVMSERIATSGFARPWWLHEAARSTLPQRLKT